MENPCSTCIVRPNCTAICFSKNNHTTLLKRAISNYGAINVLTNKVYNKEYRKYLDLDRENHMDIMTIKNRSRRLKETV